ncbi:hypothetical protein EJ08DRAFT_136069 [Tothia fuscella]|uniref:Proteasome assembly chaperone 3 n=1 Tax=Tothia fuscella TaxID=1048955 RepID=A0A9P4NUZ0_9PEZI|nr:hypothetical protein EJ08DRAFT_136069 [Tothia fuscella]
MAPVQTTPAPFPIRTKSTVVDINFVKTTITSHAFSDKILLTITQNGRLAHWIHVPLHNPLPEASSLDPSSHDLDPDLPPSTLLPQSHFTATTILGGTNAALDTLGQTLATQLASAIAGRNPDEGRMLVLGLGLDKDVPDGMDGEEFGELVGACLDVL